MYAASPQNFVELHERIVEAITNINHPEKNVVRKIVYQRCIEQDDHFEHINYD